MIGNKLVEMSMDEMMAVNGGAQRGDAGNSRYNFVQVIVRALYKYF